MYIKVKVTTGVKGESVERLKDDLLKISVREKPERNLANDRVKELLAAFFGITVGKVRLISGHHSRSKIFSISN
ncbi:MAG: DUF167 domain-containing protein [Candidatus Vogelbacteria bacterium]|nr:DUF167 domain-containing protein [Candidatus Vogelbacteria bacterium]